MSVLRSYLLRGLFALGAACVCFSGTVAFAAPLAEDHTILYYLIEMERHSTTSCDGSSVPRDVSLVPSHDLRETAMALAQRTAEPAVLSRQLPAGAFVAMDLEGTPKQALAALRAEYCSSFMNPALVYVGAAKHNDAWVLLMSPADPSTSGTGESALLPEASGGGHPVQGGASLTPGEENAAAMMSTPGAVSNNGNVPESGGRHIPAGGSPVPLPAGEVPPPPPDIPYADRSATESLPADAPENFVGRAKEKEYLFNGSAVPGTPVPAEKPFPAGTLSPAGASSPSGTPVPSGVVAPASSSLETAPAPEPTPQYMRKRPGITPLHDADPPRPVEMYPSGVDSGVRNMGERRGWVSPESDPLPDIGHKAPLPGDGESSGVQ